MDWGTPGGAGRIPPLDLNSTHKAWMQDPNPSNSDLLMGRLQPTIQKAITTYVGKTASPTINSHAKLLALNAAKSYSPTAGASLTTHVFSQLQGLKRYAGREGLILSIPERLALQKKQMERHLGDFKNEMGRDPSDDELAHRSGISPKALARIRRTPAVINEGRFYQNLEEATPDLPAVEGSTKPQEAWRDFIYHNSTEPDKVIMEHSLGLNGKPVLDNTALAARLRISPSAVSQRRNNIQKQLDAYHTLRPW